jgi:hypothetical protein
VPWIGEKRGGEGRGGEGRRGEGEGRRMGALRSRPTLQTTHKPPSVRTVLATSTEHWRSISPKEPEDPAGS